MHSQIHDGSHACHIGLGELPWLGVGKIFVADACQVHGFFLCFAEVEVVEVVLKHFFHVHKFGYGVAVVVGEFAGLGHLAFEVFVCEHEGAVHEVAEYCHQFAVVAGLEVLPSEVVVLGFGSIGCKHIAKHILLAGEIVEIFVKPYRPVLRGGNLIAFEVEEFVARHVVGQDVGAFGFKHCGEHDAVEHDVVLANEVNQAGRLVLPPCFPCVGQQFLGVADVADRCIKPHI